MLAHLPEALADRTELYEDLEDEQTAFFMLSGSRPLFGKSFGPIPISEIISITKAFPTDDLERFIRLMQAADAAYLEYINGRNAIRKT